MFCAGLNPPWLVATSLAIGVIVTVWSVITKRPGLGVAFAVATACVSGVVLHNVAGVISIRAADSNDKVYKRYFGIDSYEKDVEVRFRNILVVTGTFSLNTWLSASLYHVKSGDIREINSFTVGRTPNAIGAPHWVDMKFTLALGDRIGPEGRMTQLGSAGQSRGGGSSSDILNDVVPISTITLPGRLSSGKRRIVYLAGDPGFKLDTSMSVQQFADENLGNYLVVELELN
jgi:hypothetical protein